MVPRIIVFTILLLSLQLFVAAQEQPAADTISHKKEIHSTDSLQVDTELLKELKAMMDSMAFRKDFFLVSAGISNRLFSLRNNNFNSRQETSRLAFTPSILYYHKSGLGISVTAFLSSFENRLQFYQYAFSPSYDNLVNPKVSYGISYSYYLTRKDLDIYATPFKHEFYGYVQSRKGWLRAGLSAGWAKGRYQEIVQIDTVVFNIPRRIIDTTSVGLQDFSVTASVSHTFDFDNVLLKGDGFSVIPQVMLVAGMQNFDVDSRTTVISRRLLRYVKRNYHTSSTENTGFRFQSIAGSLNLSWFMGKFSISPHYFVSCYLPESDRKWSHIFSVMAGFTF